MLWRAVLAADNGIENAARLLLHIAETATAQLQLLALRNPKLFEPLAKARLTWPALIGTKKSHGAVCAKLIKDLKLGDENGMRSQWNPDRTCTQLAQSLFGWSQQYHLGLRLPPLSESGAWEVWFETAWRRLLIDTDGEPERLPSLKGEGRCKAVRKGQACAEIKRRTKAAFRTLTQRFCKK